MTDFFTSLVDRALDRTPVLERRQPAFFEPLTQSAAAFGEKSSVGNVSPLQVSEIVVESTPVSNAPVIKHVSRPPQSTSRREDPETQTADIQPSRPRVHDVPRPQNDPAEAQSAPLATLRETHVEQPTPDVTPTVITKPQELTVAPLRTIETIVERRVEREIVTEQTTEKPAINEVQTFARPTPQLKTNDVGDRTAEQKQSSKPEVKSPRPSKEQTTIKPSTQKKSVARQDVMPNVRALPRFESRQVQNLPAPPPSIHVTIGRVEVRATPQATNKSRTAQRVGPKLSLEDYLRSRGEAN